MSGAEQADQLGQPDPLTVDEQPEFAELDEQRWHRLHPLSPLLRGGIVFLVIIGVIFANFRDALLRLVVSDQYVPEAAPGEEAVLEYLFDVEVLLIVVLVCLAVIGLFIGFAWVSWRFHTYRIAGDAVEERSGVLFRQHRRAPLERIQSVNLQRPLIARLVGLTQVEVQTAGQGGQVTLSYLGFNAAKTLREDILRSAARSRATQQNRSHGANNNLVGPTTEGAADAATGNASAALLERRAAEILDADVAQESYESGSVVQVPLGRLIGSIALSWDLWVPVFLVVGSIVSAILWDPFFLTMIIPALFITVAVVFTSFNRGFRFTLSSTRDGVRIGAGLTSTTTESIPFGRIHALEARQPLGWRLCGWWRIRITTAGHGLAQGGQNKMQNIVLPVGTLADVERVFATLLPGVADDAQQRAELHQGIIGAGQQDGYTPAGKRSPWVLWFGARRAAIRVVQTGSLAHSSLRVRRGWMNRCFVVMPLVRAQSLQLHRPPVQRVLGLATITAHTVLGPVQVYLRGLDMSAARAFFAEAEAAIIAAQRHDSHTHQAAIARAHGYYRVESRTISVAALNVAPPVFTIGETRLG